MYNQFCGVLANMQGSGAALAANTTPTSLLNGTGKFTLPAMALQWIGQKLRLRAAGRISTAASAMGTITFDIRFGSIIVFNGGASPTLAASASNVTWEIDVGLDVATVGNGTIATLTGAGKLITPALSALIQMLPGSSPGPGTGFDSTIANVVDLFATWSAATAGDTVRCDTATLYSEL